MTAVERPTCSRHGCDRLASFIVGDGVDGMPQAASCDKDLVFTVHTMAEAYNDHNVLVVVIWHEPPRHGTQGMYTNNGCRCDECREANRVTVAAWRARQR